MKFVFLFLIKNCDLCTYSQAFIKDGQTTGEASASKTSSTSKHEILKLFSIFRAIFALWIQGPFLNPDPIRIRIRIPGPLLNPDPDSDPDLDPDNTCMIIKDE
jgi:hypothetical protein